MAESYFDRVPGLNNPIHDHDPTYILVKRDLPRKPELAAVISEITQNGNIIPPRDGQSYRILFGYSAKWIRALRRARTKIRQEPILTDQGKTTLSEAILKMDVLTKYERLPRLNSWRNTRNSKLAELLIEVVDAQQ